MEAHPLVSCVVPVFNGALYLTEAIESIEAQTWRPIEIIVVDDGSTDGTPGIIAGLGARVRALHQPNRGPSAARNAGLAAASGTFVAFLDADDLWLPDKLARQMAHFDALAALDVSLSHARNWWIDELKHEAASNADIMGGVSVAVIRRDLLDRIGMFDETLRHRDWTDWQLRAADAGAVSETLPEALVLRRIHHDNLSRKRGSEDAEEQIRLARARMARRRGTPA